MNELESRRSLADAALDEQMYWASLTGEAIARGLLSDGDVMRIQSESAALFVRQAERLTRGESTSLRAERARALTESIVYVLGLALRSCSTADEALNTLLTVPLEEIFDHGLAVIRRKLMRLQAIHARLRETLFVTRNVFYKSTIVDGLGAFFRLYRPEFSAQEIHITADYPAFLMQKGWRGIDFIERYLHALSCENRFLGCFDAGAVHRLLCGLDENYQQILMNIYEPVLTAALCCVLTGCPVQSLSVDRRAVERRLCDLNAEAIEALMSQAASALYALLHCPEGLKRYIAACLPKIARSIQRALELGCLDAVVLEMHDPFCTLRLELEQGERLSDHDYAALLSALLRCESGADMAALIEVRVRSAGDLSELLHDAAPDAHTLDELLARLPLESLAALKADYPCDDFLTDARDQALYDALERRRAALSADARQKFDELATLMRRRDSGD